MKIENETQAKAAKEFLAAWDREKELKKILGLGCYTEMGEVEKALAAYESSDKVKEIADRLSEVDRNILLVMMQEGSGNRIYCTNIAKSLDYKDLVEKLQSFATPLAKEVAAYLRSQKRELKWEVRFAECNTFVCAADYREKAENIAKAMNSSFCSRYTVREVK